MRTTFSIRARCLINWLAVGLIITASGCSAQDGKQTNSTIYDSDPKHLWNRLNETLFDRTAPDGKHFGLDELDILFWAGTKNLLVEPSHHQSLAVLDEFINSHGEKLISDPLKRALLQRDLWELFDWSAKNFRKPEETRASNELQSRLAVLIRRLALTTNEIAALPDNYAKTGKSNPPNLPQGLFQTNGDWVSVGNNGGYGMEPVAPSHVSEFDGHSAFCVMLHLPEDRQAAISYLDRLRWFAQVDGAWNYRTNPLPWLSTNISPVPVKPLDPSSTNAMTWRHMTWVSTNFPRHILELSPDLPQFPANTEWALVRRMCVIDTDGHIQPTPIIESIQLRRYLEVKNMNQVYHGAQQFFEFQLDRRRGGALRALGQDEKGFPFVHFRGQGRDLFEPFNAFGRPSPLPQDSAKVQRVILETCFECHSDRGIFSVLSYTGFLSPPPSQRPADLAVTGIDRQSKATIYWKQRQFDWGLLQGLWRQTN